MNCEEDDDANAKGDELDVRGEPGLKLEILGG